MSDLPAADERALLREVVDHPDDDTVRLVLADWYDEHGQAERAEFIRGQIALHGMEEWDEGHDALRIRCAELMRLNWAAWTEPLSDVLPEPMRMWRIGFRRGFVERLRLSYLEFARHAPALVERVPLTGVEFYADELDFDPAWAEVPELARLRDADFATGRDWRYDDTRRLLTSARLGGLHELAADHPPLDVLGRLACADRLTALEVTGVTHNGVLSELWEADPLPALRKLRVGMEDATLCPVWFRPSMCFQRLTHLDLGGLTRWSWEALGRGVDWPPSEQLRSLTLRTSTVLPQAWHEMLKDVPYPRLERLAWEDWTGVPPARIAELETLDGLRALTVTGTRSAAGRSEQVRLWPRLVRTQHRDTLRLLRHDEITDADLDAWAAGPVWPCLTRVALAGRSWSSADEVNQLLPQPASIARWLDSDRVPQLISLEVRVRDEAGDDLARALAGCPGAGRLRELDLQNSITPAGAQALAESRHLDGLQVLNAEMVHPDDTDAVQAILRDRFGDRAWV